MSTLVSQPAPSASWKQEVNRRLAAHKKRKDLSVEAQRPPAEAPSPASPRAVEAAARVAARYAKAPSYSEMQAAEARAALSAAEAATRAALEAQAAAQAALANLGATAGEKALRVEDGGRRKTAGESVQQPQAAPAPAAAVRPLEIRWEPDLPARPVRLPSASHEPQRPGMPERSIELVEPAQPIHANLIEFPRELVATRRVRPRPAGSRQDAAGDLFGQLSIFEVDPRSVSTEPAAAVAELPAPSWSGPAWSGIELDDLPEEEAETQSEAASPLQLAPLGLRLMASVVDAALIVGSVCAAVVAAANYMPHPPAIKVAEMGAIAALLATGVLYQVLFLTLAKATPGMMYARIALCTFDDDSPSRAQVRGRLGAMFLSLLPVGLGVVWSVFDEDHLCWHDRLSRTYLRKC